MKKTILTRRKALAGLGSLAAASPLVADHPPKLTGEPPGRIAPREDLVNVLEFENMAQRKLAPDVYAAIAGGDRSFFERITFRPRMMAPTTHLDLTVSLFGEKMFAPIIAGPIERLKNYHPDGEVGLVRASSAAKSWMVVSCESSLPVEKIAAESKTTLWYQVFPEEDLSVVRAKMDRAVKAGCKAIVITVRAPSVMKWTIIDQMRKGIGIPVVIKGIMTPQEATAALKHGIDGIVVSNYGGLANAATASSIQMLPSIVDAVAGKAPVLIDGSFRRGSDIFKALAYGATAVMLGRPVVWGLAAYGPDGAQQVLEMLQTEVARDMAHCGRQTIKDIDRAVIKLHEA